jgi:CYTH domain-containing protein
VKVGAGVVRIELDEPTTGELWHALWPHTRERRITKRRYEIPDGALVWQVDEFTDRDLVLAEVELPAADVVPDLPAWLAPYVVREVTEDPSYTNFALAGQPPR